MDPVPPASAAQQGRGGGPSAPVDLSLLSREFETIVVTQSVRSRYTRPVDLSQLIQRAYG